MNCIQVISQNEIWIICVVDPSGIVCLAHACDIASEFLPEVVRKYGSISCQAGHSYYQYGDAQSVHVGEEGIEKCFL